MKIGLFSDLHLEFYGKRTPEFIDRIVETAQGVDVLVNAGDLDPDETGRAIFLDEIQKRLPDVKLLSVMGNHDHYGSFFTRTRDFLFYLNGSDISFYGTTLWTNFGNDVNSELMARRCISDFGQIEGINPNIMREAFEQTAKGIDAERPTVVISHFCPHPKSIHPRWGNDPLNKYFCSDLSDLILRVKPKLWLHGHTHDPFDYTVGDTRIVCNPLGYPNERYKDLKNYSVKVIELV